MEEMVDIEVELEQWVIDGIQEIADKQGISFNDVCVNIIKEVIDNPDKYKEMLEQENSDLDKKD